jgi:hypothetical protein
VIGRLYTPRQLNALHGELVLRFRSMVGAHLPGSAFVAPYPSVREVWPNEILVIPSRSDAALFSIGFLQSDRTNMVVRIGEHGELHMWEEHHAHRSLIAMAQTLFALALQGRYREESWTDKVTGQYRGGQSYFLDTKDGWQVPRPLGQPRVPFERLRLHDRQYVPY